VDHHHHHVAEDLQGRIQEGGWTQTLGNVESLFLHTPAMEAEGLRLV